MNGNHCSLTFGGCTAPSPAPASRSSWKRKGGWVATRDGAQLQGEEEDGPVWLGSHLPWCLEADNCCCVSPSSPEPFFLLVSPPRSPCCHRWPLPSQPQPHGCSRQPLQQARGTSRVSLEEDVCPSPWQQKPRETKSWTKTLLLSSHTSSSFQRDTFPWAPCYFCLFVKTASHPHGWAVT